MSRKVASKAEIQHEFRLYFSDMQASLKAEGGSVDRETEWEVFIASKIENGDLPESAREWTL